MKLLLTELAERAYNVNPNLPFTHKMGHYAEKGLVPPEDVAQTNEGTPLEFEGDAEQQFDAGLFLNA